jgi:hypothetical protein
VLVRQPSGEPSQMNERETSLLATYFVHEPIAAGTVRTNRCVGPLVD